MTRPRPLPRLRSLVIAMLAFVFATVAGLLWLGCEEWQAPTDPDNPARSLATRWGTVTVYSNGHRVDEAALVAAIEAGYERARAQVGGRVDGVSLNGLAIAIAPVEGGYGQFLPRLNMIHVTPGYEHVVTHELQHFFANRFGFRPPVTTCVDHASGSPGCPVGYDLNGNRR